MTCPTSGVVGVKVFGVARCHIGDKSWQGDRSPFDTDVEPVLELDIRGHENRVRLQEDALTETTSGAQQAVTTVVFWALVALATITGLVTAWTLGANSNSPPFAPAIGANAISTMRAAILLGILAAMGVVTEVGRIRKRSGPALSTAPRSHRSQPSPGC